jgi:hypothetical protein
MEFSQSLNDDPSSSALIPRLASVFLGHDSFLQCVRLPQMPPQTHIQGDCNAHYDQRTNTQDQEPPDHPHSRLE